MSWERKAGASLYFVTAVPLPQVNSTPSATEIHYKKLSLCLEKKKMPKNPHKNLKCSSKPTRRVSASIPATPPARALKKIINTIQCSLKSIIKHSHLEAAQWENRMQTATVSKSQESPPKAAAERVTLNAHFHNPEGPALPFQGAPKKLLLHKPGKLCP